MEFLAVAWCFGSSQFFFDVSCSVSKKSDRAIEKNMYRETNLDYFA